MTYLHWNEQTITDFSEKNISAMYDRGYVFTRIGKGVMHQTRSVRIDLSKFELSSENKRILKKIEDIEVKEFRLQFSGNRQKHGKLEKLIVPNRHKFSSLLRKFAPDMAFMNDLKGKMEYK